MPDDYGVPSGATDAVIAATHPEPDEGGPCATCAFRPGTEANRSAHTMILARLCVEGIEPFDCHERPQACRGWIAAINLNGPPQSEDERRWQAVCQMAAEVYGRCISAAVEAQERVHA